MKNTMISTAVAALLGTASFGANAINNGDTMSITAAGSAVTSCILGTVPPCSNPLFNVTSITGSYFQMGGGTTELAGNDGIILGTTQLATGSHAGAPNGSESPGIDTAWLFASNTGMHQAVSPLTVISQTELDFSGWSVTWAGIDSIAMGGCDLVAGGCVIGGGNPDNVNTGVATIAITGSDYVLDYFANVPVGDPSGFGGAGYTLHLEGTISAVPVPAAVWLFGSGLVGLAGIARRKKATV